MNYLDWTHRSFATTSGSFLSLELSIIIIFLFLTAAQPNCNQYLAEENHYGIFKPKLISVLDTGK